ncbi:MAG: hypothetical protein IJ607_11510 [Bacteroidaceae bacterium]|nr:hypothetical protein [Bacteroidaceae bacterium]
MDVSLAPDVKDLMLETDELSCSSRKIRFLEHPRGSYIPSTISTGGMDVPSVPTVEGLMPETVEN